MKPMGIEDKHNRYILVICNNNTKFNVDVRKMNFEITDKVAEGLTCVIVTCFVI